MRDSFTLYRSVFDALMAFPADYMKEALQYIGNYAMDGVLPEGQTGVAYGLFLSVKPLIDKSRSRSEAGRTGGEAKQTQANASKQEANRSKLQANISKPQANTSNPEAKKKEEIRKEKEENIEITKVSGKPAYPYSEIIEYFNSVTGKSFRDTSKDTRRLIKARIDEGATIEDFKRVIDGRFAKWGKDPKMAEYLRPVTLFGTKFESYLNDKEPPVPSEKSGKFRAMERNYDWDDLEKKLLAAQGGG